LLAVVVYGVASVAWTIIGTIMLNYTQVVLDFQFLQYVAAGGTLLICVILFLFLFRKIIAWKGKKNGLLILFAVGPLVLCCSLFGFVSFTPATALLYGLIFIVGVAFSLGGWYLLTGIWFADLAEDDQKRSGKMKAGLYVGFPSIALNIFQALGPIILGAVLALPQTVSVSLVAPFSIGYVLWGPICAVFLVVAFFLTRRFIQWDFAWEKAPQQDAPNN
jgi:Na+/melibiose symporter-like transporter